MLLILEWHLVWAAGSGMETLLFGLAALSILGSLLIIGDRGRQTGQNANNLIWLVVGVLIGISVWLRPDGITLLAPASLLVIVMPTNWRDRINQFVILGIGFGVAFLPYLYFNFRVSGTIWPTTFFAKQAEYAFLQQTPIWKRFLDQAALPIIGVGVLLLPGFLLNFWGFTRRKQWHLLIPMLWMFGYLLMYAWRLPVTYQHGRYIMPMMPSFFIWGFAGLANFVQPNAKNPIIRILNRAWLLTTTVLILAFWLVGARAYARDVAFIESEMVTIAHWIAEHTPKDALIATHDIGALGYYSDRALLDLAGLISPEAIPFLWDGDRLGEFMNARGADFLVTFPGWYPGLTAPLTPIFQTDSPYSRDLGSENMAVYKWNIP
jgi:hypothetical protein